MSGQDHVRERIQRYSRQLVLPDVGRAGMEAWLGSTVHVVGDGDGARLARRYLRGAGVRLVEGEPADRTLELAGAEGLTGALAAVGAAGAALIGLLPTLDEPPFELPDSAIPPIEGDPLAVVVGAGGLGCPAAIGLGLAGVRRLRIIDDDVVDVSNLPRQVLHDEGDVGRPKVESAAESLQAMFPDMQIEARHVRFEPGNAEALLEGASLAIEGSDNFPTKFRVNAAAAVVGIPAVVCGVLRYDGQAIGVDQPSGAACYRCVFPDSPSPGAVFTCSSAGILGPVAGVFGLWQAALGARLLAARREGGPTPAGELWTFSARSGRWMAFQVKRDEECPACGPEPDDPALRGMAEGEGPMVCR